MICNTLKILFVLFVISGTSFAAKISDVEFPDTITLDGKNLVLNGLGVRDRTFLHVKVYYIGLYLENKTEGKKTGDELISDANQIKKITMTFARKVDSKTMREVWTESLDEQAGANKDAIATTKKEFLESLPDIKSDDKIHLTFNSKGVTMDIEQEDKAIATKSFNDPKFASTLLSVWLGQKPIDAKLRDQLLAKK